MRRNNQPINLYISSIISGIKSIFVNSNGI